MSLDRRGYSMTFWVVFIKLGLNPALAMRIELGRYFCAISVVTRVANAVVVAVSGEINQRTFSISVVRSENSRDTYTGIAKLCAFAQ